MLSLLRVGSAGVKVKQDRPPHVLEGIHEVAK